MATIQQNKGSKRAAMHPYLRIEKWADGTLAFWRNSTMHNPDNYEPLLQAEIKNERNGSVFTKNIQA